MPCKRKSRSSRVVLPMLAMGLLGGCSMFSGAAKAPQMTEARPAPASNLGQVAVLRAIGGSAVSGKISVGDHGDGATLVVSAINIPQGAYRIALHENPNCTSPNGFSAGPAWAPSGATRKADDLLPTLYASTEGYADASVRIDGLHATGANGVAGHSVVIYTGAKVTGAQSGVANERIACGVFEAVQALDF